MTDLITRDALAALGLEDIEPGRVERVAWPAEPADAARGIPRWLDARSPHDHGVPDSAHLSALSHAELARPLRPAADLTSFALVMSMLGSGQLPFIRVRHPLVERAGLYLEVLAREQPIVRVTSQEPGVALDMRSVGGRAAVHQPSDDVGTAYADLSRGACVVRCGRSGVAIAADDEGVMAQALAPGGGELEGIDVPLDAWSARSDDAWMTGVAATARRSDSWTQVVGAGVLARLVAPPSTTGDRSRSRASGSEWATVDPSVAPRLWMRERGTGERDAVERAAVRKADELRAAMVQLEDRLEPDTSAWRDDWMTICHRRDDLEGVLLLLQEAGAGERLVAALESVDHLGRLLVFHVPAGVVDADERLRRVRLGNPAAWWALPDDPAEIL